MKKKFVKEDSLLNFIVIEILGVEKIFEGKYNSNFEVWN